MIYFVQALDGGPIKIGTSTRLSVRMKQLAKASAKRLWVLGVTDGGREEERALHERFSHLRITGEWFKPDSALNAYIAREAKDWDGVDEEPLGDLVRINKDLLWKVKMLAAWRAVSVSECIEDLLRRPVASEVSKIATECVALISEEVEEVESTS